MKLGFIFAGQGQQFKGMGLDLIVASSEVKEIYQRASLVLGYDLQEVSNDENALAKTIFTQPALLTLNYALAHMLKQNGIKAEYVAGLSLGEYNALIEAEVLSFEDALKIIKERARIMSNALPKNSTGMVAILKADLGIINEVLNDSRLNNEVAICNYNTFEQIVIGGSLVKLEIACELLKEKGLKRIIPLNVSTVSHMHLLNDAAKELELVLKEYIFVKPNIKFVNNVAAEYQEDNFVETLTKQISSSTYLAQSIELMMNDGVTTFIEIGPKNTISSFIKSIAKKLDKNAKVFNVYDLETVKEVVKEMSDDSE